MSRRLILVEFQASTKSEASIFEVVDSERVNGVKEVGKKVECRSAENDLINELEEQFHYGIFRGEFTSLRLAKAEMNRLKEKEELKSKCPVLVREGKEVASEKADVTSFEFTLIKTENVEDDKSAPDLLLPEASKSSDLHAKPLGTEDMTEEQEEDEHCSDYNRGQDDNRNGLEGSHGVQSPFHLSIINTRSLPDMNSVRQSGNGIEHLLEEMVDVKKALLGLLDNQAEILKRLSPANQDHNASNPRVRNAPTSNHVSRCHNSTAQKLQAFEPLSRTRPARLRVIPQKQNKSLPPSFYNAMPVLRPTVQTSTGVKRKAIYDDLPPLKKAF